MIDLRQAAEQAFEALETCGEDEWHSEDDFGMEQTYNEDKVAKAITALKAALEQQPVQEPVALHEAVISAWSLREVYFDEDGEPSMHRSPPQRPWQGLTDEEIETTLSQLWCDINIMKFMTCDRPQQETVVFILSRAIEAKLKEKNNG